MQPTGTAARSSPDNAKQASQAANTATRLLHDGLVQVQKARGLRGVRVSGGPTGRPNAFASCAVLQGWARHAAGPPAAKCKGRQPQRKMLVVPCLRSRRLFPLNCQPTIPCPMPWKTPWAGTCGASLALQACFPRQSVGMHMLSQEFCDHPIGRLDDPEWPGQAPPDAQGTCSRAPAGFSSQQALTKAAASSGSPRAAKVRQPHCDGPPVSLHGHLLGPLREGPMFSLRLPTRDTASCSAHPPPAKAMFLLEHGTELDDSFTGLQRPDGMFTIAGFGSLLSGEA